MLETFKVHLLYPKLISSGTATAQKVPRVCLQVLWRVSALGMTQCCGGDITLVGLGCSSCLSPNCPLMEPLQGRQELLLCPRSGTAESPQCDVTAPGQSDALQRHQSSAEVNTLIRG